jgi:hypothetical protein
VLWGPLSVGALAVVATTGVAVAVVGVRRRAGRASPPVGRRGRAWVAWATAACAWEVVTLLDDDLPTVSDLADPPLAHPLLRGAVTVCWLWVGWWLITLPRDRPKPR